MEPLSEFSSAVSVAESSLTTVSRVVQLPEPRGGIFLCGFESLNFCAKANAWSSDEKPLLLKAGALVAFERRSESVATHATSRTLAGHVHVFSYSRHLNRICLNRHHIIGTVPIPFTRYLYRNFAFVR